MNFCSKGNYLRLTAVDYLNCTKLFSNMKFIFLMMVFLTTVFSRSLESSDVHLQRSKRFSTSQWRSVRGKQRQMQYYVNLLKRSKPRKNEKYSRLVGNPIKGYSLRSYSYNELIRILLRS